MYLIRACSSARLCRNLVPFEWYSFRVALSSAARMSRPMRDRRPVGAAVVRLGDGELLLVRVRGERGSFSFSMPLGAISVFCGPTQKGGVPGLMPSRGFGLLQASDCPCPFRDVLSQIRLCRATCRLWAVSFHVDSLPSITIRMHVGVHADSLSSITIRMHVGV